jgi:ribosomal protein S18 acetylase RimI-like enzyme
MRTNTFSLRPAASNDFEYIYGLCEATMRAYVEIDLGDRFEQIARPTIHNLLERRLFSKIYVNDLLVGAVASECHDTHIQLEELYIGAADQGLGVGTMVVAQLVERSLSLGVPIRLHVLASNGARLFYEKLGFAITRSTKEVNFMEYRHPSILASVA